VNPFAPLGCKVEAHIKPAAWVMWAAHTASGYYLTMPSFTPADALIKAADNLVDTINGIIPKNMVTLDAVEQLMEI